MATSEGMALDDYLFQKVENSDFLTGFIVGHLVLESLLKNKITTIHPGVGNYADRLMFSNLVELCFEMDIVNEGQKGTLKAINKMRNKLAHDLSYEPTRNELKDLFIKARGSFRDMTDGLSQGIETLSDESWKHEPGDYTLADLFIQIAYDLGLFGEE